MTRDELIVAMKTATGPDRELDEEIMCCVYADLKPERHMEGWYSASGDHIRVDRYTASIDAALTLVPEGWHAVIGARPGWPWVELYQFPTPCRNVPRLSASTPAIALCIAALRSMENADG